MSHNDDKNNGLEESNSKGMDRREFMKRTAVGVGAVAATMVAGGCGSASTTSTDVAKVAAAVPSKSAWKFAIMNDTQWAHYPDDGKNLNLTPIEVIKQVQQRLIDHNVNFVIQTGDLTENASKASTSTTTQVNGASVPYTFTNIQAEDTRAVFVQALYDAGIGFFPLRGNHDTLPATATEFQRLFPQTQNGVMNATPADAFTIPNPDSAAQPFPTKKNSATFSIGSGFSSPSANLNGLSYSFDVGNVRFVLLDQFNAADSKNADGTAYSLNTAMAAQQSWINSTLAGRNAGTHAMVFGHKGLLTQSHQDVLFGDCAAPGAVTVTLNDGTSKTFVGSPGMDAFITSLQANNVRYYVCGHDHMHVRNQVKTMDGSAKVIELVGASNSNKFYYPEYPKSNDELFCSKKRDTLFNEEFNTVGYTIVTVDGSNVIMDFYSSPAYPSPFQDGDFSTTPALTFSWRETFGYSLNGKQFVIPAGSAYTTVQDTSTAGGSTSAKILTGSNGYAAVDPAGRMFSADVNTGWLAASNSASDILVLQGMAAQMGSKQTDIFALSLSYDKTKATDAQIQAGTFALATPDSSGNWVNAVSLNFGGAKKFVPGPWKSSYGVGTYGVDTASSTVWAVINYTGYFAAVAGV